MATNSEPVTPETTMERLKEIGERDSATRTEQPSPDANSAAPVVTPATDAAPAATPPAMPAAATDEWWNGADVSHAMLRTATSAEVERMFQAAQKKIREQGAVINQRTTATPAVTAAAPAPAATPPVDPRREEYKAVFYTNPERAAEIVEEWAVEATERRERERQEQAATQQRVSATQTAARTSITAIAADYGVEQDFVEYRFLNKVLPEMNRYATEQVFRDYGGESGDPAQVAQAEEARRLFMAEPQNWRDVYAAMFGQPPTAAAAPAIAVPAVPQRADPPHSMAVAPPSAPRRIDATKKLPADMDRSLTKLTGLSEEGMKRFKERVAAASA